jgi:hypothetical protein
VSVQKIINHNPDLNAANGFTYDGVNSWTANSVSFNGIPMAQADIATPEDVNRLDRHAGYKNWDVTGMVREWVLDAGQNYGLLLNSGAVAGSDSYRAFASSKAADAAIRPFLEITYTEPGSSAAEDVNHLDRHSGYKHWDVTGMVQDWIRDAASNYGLMLNSDSTAGADSFRFFASSEAADPALRPVLEVTYTTNHK